MQRLLFLAGSSKILALPADWVRGLGLKHGDRLDVAYNDLVVIKPRNIRLGKDQIAAEVERLVSALEVDQ